MSLTSDCVTKPGTATVKVISTGYRDKEYTIDFSDWTASAPPAYDGFTENDADDYIISFEGEDNAIKTFLGRITSVTVDGQTYSKGNYSYVYYNNEYVVSETTLLLGDHDIAYKGKTEVIIKAADYDDLTFTIDTSSRTLLSAPTASNPVYTEVSSSYYKDYYRITLSGDNVSGFISNISAVTVDGVEYSKYSGYGYSNLPASASDKYMTGSLYIDLADDSVEYIGRTEVVIKSKGYEDLTFEIDTTNLGRMTVAAPEIAAVKFVDGYYVDYYQVTFESAAAQAYVTNISSITVGETPYTKISSRSFNYGGNTNSFVAEQVYYDNSNIYALRFTDDAVNDIGNTSITVKAKGYETLTFTINAGGNLVTE